MAGWRAHRRAVAATRGGNDTINPYGAYGNVNAGAGNDRVNSRGGYERSTDLGTGTDEAERDAIDVINSVEGSF